MAVSPTFCFHLYAVWGCENIVHLGYLDIGFTGTMSQDTC